MSMKYKYYKMRVKHQKMQYQPFVNDSDLEIQLAEPCDEFFACVQMQQFPEWVSLHLSDKYHLINLKHNKICFNPIHVLAQINHDQLKTVLNNIFAMFTVYQIYFNTKVYEKQISLFIQDISNMEEPIFHQIYKTNNPDEQQLRIYCLDMNSINEIIDEKLQKIQTFRQQTLVYSLDDYLSRMKLDQRDWRLFTDALLKGFQPKLKTKIQQKMRAMGMQNQIIIKTIQPFNEGKTQQYINFKGKTGIKFTLLCFEVAASKLYHIIQRWFQKLNWMILQVDEIECCKKQNIQNFLQKKYHKKMALLSTYLSSGQQYQKLVIFDPKKCKQELIGELRSMKRIISGLDYPNYDFSNIEQYKNFFIDFTSSDHHAQLRMSIYSDYMVVECSRNEQAWLRKKIGDFLQEYDWQTVQISYLVDSFQISIFREFYATMIQIKPITLFQKEDQPDKLYRKNWKKIAEGADSQIMELYKQMRKQIVTAPLLKKTVFSQHHFKVSAAPEYQDLQYLESRRFRIQNKVTVNVRSYGSVNSGEKDCIFIIRDLTKCTEFNQILKEENMNNFQNKINKNRIIEIHLRYSPVFDKITSWVYTPNQIRNKVDKRWLERLKTDFEQFLQANQSQNHLKVMLPTASEQFIEHFLPPIIEVALDNCNFLQHAKLRELTFFTSTTGGPQIRNSINLNLKRMSEKGFKIERTSDMNLQINELQNIIEYHYFKLSYFENESTNETTALNSFLFQHERKKKGKTPIFLPTRKTFQQLQIVEYLVNFEDESVSVIKGKKVRHKILKLDDLKQLSKIARITKRYFGMITYLLVFGTQDGSFYSKRLFFTSSEQAHYKSLLQVQLDLVNQKILTKKKKLNYEIVKHEYVGLYKVETHQEKLGQLARIIDKM